jgi:hypothetical protein
MWLVFATGIFIGYWLGTLRAIHRLNKARKTGQVTINSLE